MKKLLSKTINLYPLPYALVVVAAKFIKPTESRLPWFGFKEKDAKSYFIAKGCGYYLGMRLI